MIRDADNNIPLIPGRLAGFYKVLLSFVLIVCAAAYVFESRHWLLVGDAPLFHYILFLHHHGFTPYRDVVDLNLPGTYFIQATAIRMFGTGAPGWRAFDFLLLGIIGLADVSLCGGKKFAALFAASIFALIHGRDGLIETGQRDLVMTALLLIAASSLVRIIRKADAAHRVLSGIAGLCIGIAAIIKPLAFVLLPAWLAVLWLEWRKQRAFPPRVTAFITTASLAAPLAALGMILHWHAFKAFAFIMGHLVPLHADMFRLPLKALISGCVSSVMLGILAAWLPLAWHEKTWLKAESAVLLIGFAFGILSFIIQGRGYPYHRYPSEAFLLLLAAQSFEAGLASNRRWIVFASSLGLAFGTLVIAPRSLMAIGSFTGTSDKYGAALQHELQYLKRNQSLDHEAQCLDQAGGCITQLYNARVVQATGFIYDCYLFVPPRNAADSKSQAIYRKAFFDSFLAAMPKYLIVTSDECGLRPVDFSYAKLRSWHLFSELLAQRYRPLSEWTPTEKVSWGGKPKLPFGFRIYERTIP